MVKLQLAANAIAKSRSQIKPKPVKGSSINTILIFSMADVLGAVAIFLVPGRARASKKFKT